MKEEFEKLVAAGRLSRNLVGRLLELTEASYCVHRSWGFGKIVQVDTIACRLTIDFEKRAGHSMDLAFAAESLKPIASTHILARKASQLDGLRQMAAVQHVDLIKLVLQSYGGKATVDQIQQVLVPDVIAADWKKWWEVAKRELKKDGHFLVPIKKSDPIVYQAKDVPLQERLLQDCRVAKGLKARLTVAHEIHRNLLDLENPAAAAEEILRLLNADINSHQRTQPGLALEAMFAREEIRQATAVPPDPADITEHQIWANHRRPAALLETIPAPKHKRALSSFKQAFPDTWATILIDSLNSMSTKLCTESAQLLIENGQLEPLKEQLARLVSQHQASSELLLWLAKERSDSFADILVPEVFRAMLTAMERDQFNEKRSNKLRDYILDDQNLLVELIGSADLEVIKDLTRSLQLSPCFDDMDKRSLLARIVKSYPAVQSLISGEQTKQDTTLVVSWESLERRRNEYAELVHKKIPANSKEIAIARSYGDLRENHEYKAAKEMQKLLMRRKAELETQLVRARGTDFANARTDLVTIGSKVLVTDLLSQHAETYSILGAWDSAPEQGIISYLSPLAKAMLNRKVGEEFDFELNGARKHYRVEQISLFNPAPAQSSAGASNPEPTTPNLSVTQTTSP